MLKSRAPVPIFPQDFISNPEFRALSLEEKGLLFDLILCVWLMEGLPNDDAKLAKLVGITTKRFRRIFRGASGLFEKFFEIKDEVVISPYLAEQREKLRKWKEKSSLAGRNSWAARNRNGLNQSSTPNPNPKPDPYYRMRRSRLNELIDEVMRQDEGRKKELKKADNDPCKLHGSG